jgi:transcriptional regulator with XRE-family HTH domain
MMDGELGAFLRSRREALSPAQAGLPTGPRRRATGLRRAEVATLAGVSVEYLIRLEQGRDNRPSIQVLAALAAALRLTEADRDHLHQLAAHSHGTELCPRDRRVAARTVRPAVQALLDQLGHAPALAVNHLWDVLAGNDASDRLLRPLGALDGERPNLLWHLFADERARDAYPDWADVADSYVADLHRLRRGDPGTDAFADRLARAAGAPFADRWRLRPVAGPGAAVRAVCHPEVGLLRLTVETLHLTDAAHQRVLVHLPADEATAVGLDRLMARPPQRLHAVGD